MAGIIESVTNYFKKSSSSLKVELAGAIAELHGAQRELDILNGKNPKDNVIDEKIVIATTKVSSLNENIKKLQEEIVTTQTEEEEEKKKKILNNIVQTDGALAEAEAEANTTKNIVYTNRVVPAKEGGKRKSKKRSNKKKRSSKKKRSGKRKSGKK